MKFILQSAYFLNRAPIEEINLDFSENEIVVLAAVNGRGKTTVLSHIVDAFHEMARPYFETEYEGRENKFYRVSSMIENLDMAKPSIAYIRFKYYPEEKFDYVNIRGKFTEADYNALPLPEPRIPFGELKEGMEAESYVKKISSNLTKTKAREIFSSNVLTYFPSYRHENPGYLNDLYSVDLNFSKQNLFSGTLLNPLEVVSGLAKLANWLMDVVLDLRSGTADEQKLHFELFSSINKILSSSLKSKHGGPLRFGVGKRGLGSVRLQILTSANPPTSIYPTIFNLSSGESAVLCLFCEVLRQSDKIGEWRLNDVSGIVLVDEIDKHLHIRLQKEVLPDLLNLFPNVQFILSSHSPFLGMGLAQFQERSKILDLDVFGIPKDPISNDLYDEVYRMMIGENERYRELYLSLSQKVKAGVLPLIITEGKTDIQH